MGIFGYHLIFVRTVPSHTTTSPPPPPLSLPNADAEIRDMCENYLEFLPILDTANLLVKNAFTCYL